MGIPSGEVPMVTTTQSRSNSKKVGLHPYIWGLICYISFVQSLFVELEGVKTISCNMVRLDTYDSMEDNNKTGKTTSPKDDGYDYEVPDWMKDERIMVRYRGYKDWI